MENDGLFKLDKVSSDFVVAYTLLRKDRNPVYALYAEDANSEFLERVVKGIVAMRVGDGRTGRMEGRTRLRELLPAQVYPLIDQALERKEWVNLEAARERKILQ